MNQDTHEVQPLLQRLGSGEIRDRFFFKFLLPLQKALLSAVPIHVSLLALFVGFGVRELVWVNLVSVPLYVVAVWLSRRGHGLLAYALGAGEILFHQVAAVHVIGWASGFQYYLLAVSIFAFFVPLRSYATRALIFLTFALTFILLYAIWHDAAPMRALDPTLLDMLGYVNITVAVSILGLISFYYGLAGDISDEALAREYQRSEALLRNILPAPIAARLKEGESGMADAFADASILFADIVGFTALSATLSPRDLTAMLDDVFSVFDGLVAERGLEKIKTIGDAYMVAAGVPSPRPDGAVALVDLGLAMNRAVAGQSFLGHKLRMRIGVNSGPVVAGVIGKQKFSYDIWGDTVNLAARMESHGLPGVVQVSETTAHALGDMFCLERREGVRVKGKGVMDTWLVRE